MIVYERQQCLCFYLECELLNGASCKAVWCSWGIAALSLVQWTEFHLNFWCYLHGFYAFSLWSRGVPLDALVSIPRMCPLLGYVVTVNYAWCSWQKNIGGVDEPVRETNLWTNKWGNSIDVIALRDSIHLIDQMDWSMSLEDTWLHSHCFPDATFDIRDV